jgi:RNA polymerase sigma-70 factor (ECF subfamily)
LKTDPKRDNDGRSIMAVPQSKGGSFPTTHWSLIDAAERETERGARPALTVLLSRYLPALAAHLRMRRSVPTDRIDDVLQSFISRSVLESDLLAHADPGKGKFRSLLLTALDRFVISQQRYDGALKRGSQRTHAIDGEVELTDGKGNEPPADAFDVEWARQILAETLTRMRALCESQGRADVWGVFECRVLKPATEGAAPLDYAEVVRRFSYDSPSQMWNAVRTAKQIFARIVRAVIAEYAESDQDIESELRDLRSICSRAPAADGGGTLNS